MSMAEVIRAARREKKMSQQALARQLGVGRTAVANWESGAACPEAGTIPPLAEALGVSVSALFGAREAAPTREEQAQLSLLRRLTPLDRAAVESLMRSLLSAREQEYREACRARFVRRPLMEDKVCAGSGNPLENADAAEEVFLRRTEMTARADLLVTVTGDSMEPLYRDGDRLLVGRAESLRPGEIGIFVVAGEGTVKEYREDGLYPRNPAYPPIRPAEDDAARCVGRVLGKAEECLFPDPEEARVLEAEA